MAKHGENAKQSALESARLRFLVVENGFGFSIDLGISVYVDGKNQHHTHTHMRVHTFLKSFLSFALSLGECVFKN